MNEIVQRARSLWANAGLLADPSEFTAVLEPPYLTMFVDLNNVGRKGSFRVRCIRRLDLAVANAQLADTINAMYREVMQSLARTNNIGVKF